MLKNKLGKTVAEHFTYFLVSKGYMEDEYCMNKKKLTDIFKDEYLPLYHVRMTPYLILQALAQYKCIKRVNKDTPELVLFKASKVQEIVSSHGGRVQEPLPPSPPDKSVTDSVMKVYVTQQHAFHIGFKREPAVTSTECKICSVNFADEVQYEAHLGLESHTVKEAYRSNRKSLFSKHSISVKFASEDVVEEIIVRDGAVGSVSVTVSNTGMAHCQLLKIFVLYQLTEIEEMLPALPLHLKPGGHITISLDYDFRNSGAYLYPLLLKVLDSRNISSYILKELVFRVQSELMDDLKPTSPYKRPLKNVMKHCEGPIVYGEPMPPIPNRLVSARKLPQYEFPQALRHVINHGFKPLENMNPAVAQKLKEVRLLLGQDGEKLLKEEKYTPFFRLLLYIEEHQMENDIHAYDCKGQKMEAVDGNKNLLCLTVPGLAENRPSVLRGDSIFVMIEGEKSVKYEGVVHHVRELELLLGFHRSLREKFLPNMKFCVQFGFNRWNLRCQHRALEMIKSHGITNHLFPSKHTTIPLRNVTITKWFSKHLSGNPKQRQAVQSIVSGTSYPAPYVIFGPPGTGKTVTIVEAVTQLYHLDKPNGHLLICAPSNSAANEVTKRLLISCQGHIPDRDIFRLYAASYNVGAIPEELKKCSNYTDDFFFPSKEEIMKYAVVVVTLATAARLVTGGIPAGHFSHLFIDESGQAVEPETLIPVGGLFTSEKENGRLFGQLVLAGDPKQLGPILRSPVAINLGLGMSFLERLMNQCDLYKKNERDQLYNPAVLTKLVQNFRSHKSILALPDRMFYEKELQVCGDPVLTSLACSWEGLPKKGFPLIFHGVKGKDQREGNSPSYFNVQEIEVIVRYVEQLLADRFSGRKLRQQDIGVITPYRKQVEKIKQTFKKCKWEHITVGSVEEFQGQERLVIIISTVRSTVELLQDDYKLHLGFLKNPKRFNVALTRSKALLITVGNPDILQHDEHWRELILFCRDHGGYKGYPLRLSPLSQQVEHITFDLSSLRIDLEGSSNTQDAPQWHSDI
ncbi:putative helicase mov-10-B.1 [Zootermopsis nevadensis]|uniref:RNA helicase n=1 Tax=Zootermopsis nevadensis TaxID=136037 RepID=A0A067QX16_ZOONE|nr:putative helicase mov-10-B.1 [Zootermopsis nevadensis]KDR14736.1 Putative helicase mov-10-A [Zootermopsis nevadensis]